MNECFTDPIFGNFRVERKRASELFYFYFQREMKTKRKWGRGDRS